MAMSLHDIQLGLGKLKDWGLEGNSIMKEYTFADFKLALYFVNKVGEIAEKQEHHPLILIDGPVVRLSSTTHSEKGLIEYLQTTQPGIKEKDYVVDGRVIMSPKSYSKEFARGFSEGEKGYTDEQRI